VPNGIHASGDVLTRTRDGQDLNAIWNQYQELLRAWNATRQPLIDLLSFNTDQIVDDVAQGVEEDFEEATEFGQPKSIRPNVTARTTSSGTTSRPASRSSSSRTLRRPRSNWRSRRCWRPTTG
jgi:hypothetical protein